METGFFQLPVVGFAVALVSDVSPSQMRYSVVLMRGGSDPGLGSLNPQA